MNDVITIISLVGSIASIVGIWFTYKQVVNIKKVTEATKEATEKTQNSIMQTLSIVQVTKYCESIETILESIRDDEFKLAIHLCRELKAVVIELNTNNTDVESPFRIPEGDYNFDEHVKQLGINIQSMEIALPKVKGNKDNKAKLKKDKLIEDFDNLLDSMTELKVKLKNSTQN